MEKENKIAVPELERHGKERKMCSFFSALSSKRKKIAIVITTMFVMNAMTAISAFAAGGESGGGGGLNDNAGTDQFNSLVKFFGTWIGRIGLVVAFVGAIMFGLSIKNEDSEQKTRGLMTLASGIVVFAICQSISFFLKM